MSLPLPAIGDYICGQFEQGVPMNGLVAFVRAGDAGYVAPLAGGAITGALQFPSNFIPPLTVYAISTADQRVWFSVGTPRYPLATNTPPQPSYAINGVAPGSYYVVAYRVDGQLPDPGIYSRYVVNCKPGAPSAACADHSLIPVNVTASQTTSGIDMTDWSYGAPGQPAPTIPPRPTPR